MSDYDSNPFADPHASSPFADPSVQQAAGSGAGHRQGALDDYNPFAEGNQTRPANQGGSVPPPRPANQPAIMTPSEDPPPYSQSSAQKVDTSELQRRQERENNWPPLPGFCPVGPCFYQDFNVDIPLEFQRIQERWLRRDCWSTVEAQTEPEFSVTVEPVRFPMMDLKTIIEDELYENLRDRFLHHGRGRPKMLPAIDEVTNKLLVQLAYIKEEGQKPDRVITDWLTEIQPDVGLMAASESHFSHLSVLTKRKFVALPASERDAFLQKYVDLSVISDSLTPLGITRKSFNDTNVAIVPVSITNQVVVDLEQFRVLEGQSQKRIFQLLFALTAVDMTRLVSLVKSTMKAYTKKWTEDPSDLLNPSFKSVFGEKVIFHCPEINAVQGFLKENNVNTISKIVKAVSFEALVVTERQLSDFLTGGDFSNVSDNRREQLKHCPLTNLIGESAFGDIDYDFSKRRNCSLHNRSSIHCLKRNKTMTYLEKKTVLEQKEIFQIARAKAPSLRRECREAEEKVINATREKFIENQQKKLEKEINDIDRRSNISEAVLKHGGPCLRLEDIDELEERLVTEGRSDSSFNFFVFFFIFFFQFCVYIISSLGITDFTVGIISGLKMVDDNVAVALIMIFIGIFYIILAVLSIIILIKVHRIYRSTGASFQKAQAEFASGVMKNETVRGAAADAAAGAARSAVSGYGSENRY
ncbi:secretory carrier-associated membrane protein [Elysia marginata]|uniref:Secretory carrier-associated membrane protein n=1 Tax=Elysia marginata TaxID=1093978 RepID=A0AAV4GJP7_9GAST|nr:secretory carrier-associated membrane protein [Elysia marginata]